jgi:hypothetical protein
MTSIVGAAPFRNVGLFVDWNAQLLEAPPELKTDPVARARYALSRVGKRVTRMLCSIDEVTVFRIAVRLYHGWTAGVTPTPNRHAILTLPEFYDPESLFPSTRVLAPAAIEFGDRLIDGERKRLVTHLQIHLPNTLRRVPRADLQMEKMVDGAIGADLLSWARSEPNSLALVISSDDDIVPPIFVAEAWMQPMGGGARLLRPAARRDSRFLNLEGILV